MAQVPSVPGASHYRTLLSQSVQDFIEARETIDVDFIDGVYQIDSIETMLQGEGLLPPITFGFTLSFTPARTHRASHTPAQMVTVASYLTLSRAEVFPNTITGPGLLRILISEPVSDPLNKNSYEGARIVIRAAVRRIDSELAEYIDESSVLEEYVSDPLGEYLVSAEPEDADNPLAEYIQLEDVPFIMPDDDAVLPILSSPPENPRDGDAYIDRLSGVRYVYVEADGWMAIAEPPVGILTGGPGRIRGARERRHQPFWGNVGIGRDALFNTEGSRNVAIVYGDLTADTTVGFQNPRVLERRHDTLYDAYICDASRGDDYCPGHAQTSVKRLFSSSSTDPFICNAETPGAVPREATMRIQRVGLCLDFSDPELYTMAFRFMSATLSTLNIPARDFHAREWLAAAVEDDHDFNPSLGFTWFIDLDRPITVPTRATYDVHLHLAEPLVGRLREAEDALMLRSRTGDWGSDGDRERFSGWYAELRIILNVLYTREIL